MDILRKELEGIYAEQHLETETLDPDIVKTAVDKVMTTTVMEGDCRVITDASADKAYVVGGAFASLIGLGDSSQGPFVSEVASSDEDAIYNRMHPADLVYKRMLEYEFFRHVNNLDADAMTRFRATCRIRLLDRNGNYIHTDNTTRILQPSPHGRIWLILCTYALSADQNPSAGIRPAIVDSATGQITHVKLDDKRDRILSAREKQILLHVRNGLASKQIADKLDISIHTVNRHRQNIIAKLSVGNMVEAIKAAFDMNLI